MGFYKTGIARTAPQTVRPDELGLTPPKRERRADRSAGVVECCEDCTGECEGRCTPECCGKTHGVWGHR